MMMMMLMLYTNEETNFIGNFTMLIALYTQFTRAGNRIEVIHFPPSGLK